MIDDQTPQRVFPEGLNYGDVTPEIVGAEIRLIRFQPTAAVSTLRAGDQVKFFMQSSGFLDPYSTYVKIIVNCNDLADNEIRFLDSSAHSLISRLYLTCNGIECERIDDYDIMAKGINDMMYSQEQQMFHGFEGFPSQQIHINEDLVVPSYSLDNVMSSVPANRQQMTSLASRRNLSMLMSGSAASTNHFPKVGEPCFFKDLVIPTTNVLNLGHTGEFSLINGGFYQGTFQKKFLNGQIGDHIWTEPKTFTDDATPLDMLTYDYIENGVAASRVKYTETPGSGNTSTTVATTMRGQTEMMFIIPLYSSIVGVLMPQRRFIPLRVFPVDLELTLNKYALYSSLSTGSRNYTVSRIELFSHVLFFYSDIPKIVDELAADKGLHFHLNSFYRAPVTIIDGRTLPGTSQIQMNFAAINSVHCFFIYSGYGSSVTQRKLHFVSHGLNKLQIQNGTFQIPNEVIEPTGLSTSPNAGTNINNAHAPYLIELLKAYNRLHDASLDSGLYSNIFSLDSLGIQARGQPHTLTDVFTEQAFLVDAQIDPTLSNSSDLEFVYSRQGMSALAETGISRAKGLAYYMVQKQSNVGRCQYAISLEGEQLSEQRTAITGRKAVLPFNIQLQGTKAENTVSEMYTFLRHDSVLEVRTDLSIQLTR